ncbi:putative Zn-dependent hydrolase, beta-lactamase fold-containing protein [Sphingomonas sp. RIT328]|nr:MULTISPECIES: MBL fold metallo-hydrolase [unclassified Sphingomonas]EZP55562.1 putative Zn-dependent hydrolase, beta-lactamase fold-containing protein [Sphingomonas sp. RIT328]
MARLIRPLAGLLVLIVVVVGLGATIVPRFLDRLYYRGPPTDHFDGARFVNPDRDSPAPTLPGGRAGFFWRQLTGSDGRPRWPAQVAVTPARPAARVDGDRMVVTWIGHATVLIQTQGLNILTDPIYADRAGPLGFGPRRVAAPGVRLADLPRIDLILVSHDHYDHLDLAALGALWRRDHPAIVTSLGNDSVIGQAGARALGLDWGGSATIDATGLHDTSRDPRCDPDGWCPGDRARVFVTRNHHWGSRWFSDRNRALWSSFVVRLPRGGNLFFAGDTGFGDGLWPAEAAAYGPIRFAMIPIGAFRFQPGQMASGSHIGPAEAALIHQRLGAARSLPIHWGTFRLSYEGYDTPPRMLAAAMRCSGGDGFAAQPIGVPFEVPVYAPPARGTPMTAPEMMRCLDTPAVRALR